MRGMLLRILSSVSASGSRPPARNSIARPGEPAEILWSFSSAWASGQSMSPAAQAARTASAKSARSSGRNDELHAARADGRHHGRGAMADEKEHRARRRLLDGLEQRVGRGDGEIVRGIDDHGAPAAGAREAQEGAQLAHLVHADGGRTLPRPALRRARTERDARPPRFGARRGGLRDGEGLRGPGAGGVAAQQEARRAIGEGRLADAALAGDEPGVMQRARVEGAQEGFLGRRMAG